MLSQAVHTSASNMNSSSGLGDKKWKRWNTLPLVPRQQLTQSSNVSQHSKSDRHRPQFHYIIIILLLKQPCEWVTDSHEPEQGRVPDVSCAADDNIHWNQHQFVYILHLYHQIHSHRIYACGRVGMHVYVKG
jgi:hypothetical protein